MHSFCQHLRIPQLSGNGVYLSPYPLPCTWERVEARAVRAPLEKKPKPEGTAKPTSTLSPTFILTFVCTSVPTITDRDGVRRRLQASSSSWQASHWKKKKPQEKTTKRNPMIKTCVLCDKIQTRTTHSNILSICLLDSGSQPGSQSKKNRKLQQTPQSGTPR